ncbi:MAG: glycogen synthase, partial [Verrucomicrobiota bacterium]
MDSAAPVNAARKVLMVAPEVVPLVKVGGLADVVGSLPGALHGLGIEARVVCPLYGSVRPDADWKAHEEPLIVYLGEGPMFCRVWETRLPGAGACRLYFLEHDQLFGRPEVYAGPWGDHADNDRRFTFLSRAAIDLCRYLRWTPDIFHCHDWTTGLLPVYLNTTEAATAEGRAASVMTIHNLQFQGIFRRETLNFAGLPDTVFRADGLESMGYLNMLKGGIYHASKVTTVSPHYAAEIQTPALGCGLHHVLNFRAADLIGVLNGIDEGAWNPATDPKLPANYHSRDLSGKAACKEALQKRLLLDIEPGVPIFGAVGRLYSQKGLDLLVDILGQLANEMQIQVVVLGSGDHETEEGLNAAARRFPGKVGVYIGYDDALAHLIYA